MCVDVPHPVDPPRTLFALTAWSRDQVTQHLHPGGTEVGESLRHQLEQVVGNSRFWFEPAAGDEARVGDVVRGIEQLSRGGADAIGADQQVAAREVTIGEGGRDVLSFYVDILEGAVEAVAQVSEWLSKRVVKGVPCGHPLRGLKAGGFAMEVQLLAFMKLDADRRALSSW